MTCILENGCWGWYKGGSNRQRSQLGGSFWNKSFESCRYRVAGGEVLRRYGQMGTEPRRRFRKQAHVLGFDLLNVWCLRYSRCRQGPGIHWKWGPGPEETGGSWRDGAHSVLVRRWRRAPRGIAARVQRVGPSGGSALVLPRSPLSASLPSVSTFCFSLTHTHTHRHP